MNSINLIFSDYKKFIENTLNCEIEKMYSYVDSPDVVDVVSEEYLKPVCNNQGVIIIYFKDVNDRVAQFALDEITCVIYFNEKETIDCKASFMVFLEKNHFEKWKKLKIRSLETGIAMHNEAIKEMEIEQVNGREKPILIEKMLVRYYQKELEVLKMSRGLEDYLQEIEKIEP